MISVAEAERIILDLTHALDADRDQETVDLRSAAQRVLAVDITGERNFPYWDNSAMDGYAVRHADLGPCTPTHPTALEVVTEIPAGTQSQQAIGPGEAARIFTGSMMPAGADTVVMQEDTQRQGTQVLIHKCPPSQAYVRHQGDYYQAGAPLLSRGSVLGAPDLAVLATVQCTQIPVYRRPVVAILSTGNELIDPDETLQPGQIIDSNRYALAALVQQTGATVIGMERVRDRTADLSTAIRQALDQADVILSTGGVSVGDYDYVEQTLTQLGAQLAIHAVAIKPGKPLTVAHFPATPDRPQPRLYFGLPGNPASALVCFWRFVQPALRKLAGASQNWGPTFVQARTTQPLPATSTRETYRWGTLSIDAGTYLFTPASGRHNSANLMNLAQTSGLAVLPPHNPAITASNIVTVLQIGSAVIPHDASDFHSLNTLRTSDTAH